MPALSCLHISSLTSLPPHCSQDIPDPDLAALVPPLHVPILVPTAPFPPCPAPRLPADSHGTAAGSWSMPLSRHPVVPLVLVLFLPLFPSLFQAPSLPSFPLPSDLAQLSSKSTLSASPLGFFPLAATPQHHQSMTGWLAPQLCQWPSLFAGRPQACPALPPASLCILLRHLLTWGGVCLAQVRRTSGHPRAQAREQSPLPGPILGGGSETWFSRHTPGILPRYSSLTHRLMPCLYILLGEVWVHGALVVRVLGGAAWVAQPQLSRTPLDWDSELGGGSREKLR